TRAVRAVYESADDRATTCTAPKPGCNVDRPFRSIGAAWPPGPGIAETAGCPAVSAATCAGRPAPGGMSAEPALARLQDERGAGQCRECQDDPEGLGLQHSSHLSTT